jgi:two-component system response regulator
VTDLAEILLVEDNPDELELALSALKESNFANPIHVARDGAEALEFLFARGRYTDRAGARPLKLVLLDLKLPLVDGIEVLRQIKADPVLRTVPTVIMTSSQQESDLVTSYDLGANSYISKPIDVDRFVETIAAIGLYWIVLNERPRG